MTLLELPFEVSEGIPRLNTSCLRRSLMALSVAAATVHTPGVQAATLNYDVGGGPLINYNQYYDFVNLTGTANVVQTSPSVVTSAAQFTTLTTNYDVTNKASITIDGATHGAGIVMSRGTSPWPRIGNNLVNQGSININGLADIGESIGIADNGNQIVGNFINYKDIAVTGNNATGVSLIGSQFGKGVINQGSIVVSGANSHGIYLENTTQTMPVYNEKVLTATGVNAEALMLKGAAFIPEPGVNM